MDGLYQIRYPAIVAITDKTATAQMMKTATDFFFLSLCRFACANAARTLSSSGAVPFFVPEFRTDTADFALLCAFPRVCGTEDFAAGLRLQSSGRRLGVFAFFLFSI